MKYLTYEEYKELGGTLEEIAFNKYILRVCNDITARTKKRIIFMKNIPQEAKELCRDLIEYFYYNMPCGAVTTSKSYTAGAVSESESYSVKSQADISDEVDNMFNMYFNCLTDDNGTPLLYRGCSA